MTPSIGRVVHYVSHGTPVKEDGTQTYTSECRAAIITAVPEDVGSMSNDKGYVVSLCVLNPTGMFFNDEVWLSEDGKAGGTWHWPERV